MMNNILSPKTEYMKTVKIIQNFIPTNTDNFSSQEVELQTQG